MTMPAYGEGISIGTAQPNWCEYTQCAPDASDHNVLLRNAVFETKSEAIEGSEGTSNGAISNNRLAVADDAQVDSVIAVNGANQVRTSGVGTRIDQLLDGWGVRNVILGNSVAAPDGYAIEVVGDARDGGNIVGCTETHG
ncbi:MAG: hypothetical protein NT132_03995 [Microbacterium sp.]|uniref:hypothetical protein n=1 Tax=Microbacterium sp. TaxID=51671 RepID=UPI00260B302F|nr:hypothetical protein [Microbacterium sp.]MCX6501561.1 hypothetical protein [Microbacterium sp.]